MNAKELIFFENREAFREWLEANHDKVDVLHIGYYKKGSKRPSITYPQSVDEALCFGWIDGVRHTVGDDAYTLRFTPRRKGSIWSAKNIARVAELTDAGRMAPPGIAAFEARDPAKANLYSFEQRQAKFSEVQQAQFEANEAAWAYFQTQPAGYQRLATWWVISPKQEATRRRRLDTLIEDSTAGRRIGVLLPRREGR